VSLSVILSDTKNNQAFDHFLHQSGFSIMGLHSDILKWLCANVAPKARQIGIPFDWVDSVVIDDALTRLRRLYNKQFGEEFTGRELYTAFSKLVWEIFAGGGEIYVCCCDITDWVPAEKNREQKQRDAARPSVKYPPESEVCNEGIRIFQDAQGRDPPFFLPAKRFNIQTLCGSRIQVREKMMRYLCDCFKYRFFEFFCSFLCVCVFAERRASSCLLARPSLWTTRQRKGP
jgi:hypothetical protein